MWGAFATDWLVNLYGAEIRNAIGRKHATRWNNEPYALGAWSASGPGGQFTRKQLLGTLTYNVWYAGEAAHETLWGTLGGAWESGERAADAALRQIGGLKPLAPEASQSDTSAQGKAKRAKPERRPSRYGDSYGGGPSYTGTPNIMRER